MNYSVSKESIRGKAMNEYKAQWVKDEACLKLIKVNIEEFNKRTNFLLIKLISELSSSLLDNTIENTEKLEFLDKITSHLQSHAAEHESFDDKNLKKFQGLKEFKSIIAFINIRNNFCGMHSKVLNYIEKGAKDPGSITITNISSVIAAYSRVTSAQTFLDMVNYYPQAVRDFTSFLNEIEDRSKFMSEFVSKSPLEHRSYEILNEMNTKIFWNGILKGMTDIYEDSLSNSYFISRIYETGVFNKRLEEKEFFINVLELLEINPNLDLALLNPYVSFLLGQKNLNPNSLIIRRYFDNTLMPFVRFIKNKDLDKLKDEIISQIETNEIASDFIEGFSLTNLDLLEKKVQIILKRTNPKIPGFDSDDYAYNYFLQDKAPWLPNHISQAKSALITERLKRHHDVSKLKVTLNHIRNEIKDNHNANLNKRLKINNLYQKLIKREKESLDNLYFEELKGIKVILVNDFNDCSGFGLNLNLCDELLNLISNNGVKANSVSILSKLSLLSSDLKYKITQSEGLIFNDPHLNKLKSMFNSVENLKNYLQNNFQIENCAELYSDLPFNHLPFGRYVHNFNNEIRKKNFELQHSKMLEHLENGCQNYADYLININNHFASESTNNIINSNIQFKAILNEIRLQEDVGIEQIYDKFSNSTDDKMHLMLMYSAAKMQLFSNKLNDILKVSNDESSGLSEASQPFAFIAKYGKHKLFNNPFGMLYNFYISYRMKNYSKFLTNFSNKDPNKYRIYEIFNHHASSPLLTRFSIKAFNLYRKDFINYIKNDDVSKFLTEFVIKLLDGVVPKKFSNDPRVNHRLISNLENYLPSSIQDYIKKYILEIFDSMPKIRDEIISRLIPFYIKYGSLDKIDYSSAKNDLVDMLESFFNSIGQGDNLLPLISEDEIINNIIELQDLSKITDVNILPSMVKEILSNYDKNYSDPDSEEYHAFDAIFSSKGLLDGVSIQYDNPKYRFIFRLKEFYRISSMLDSQQISEVILRMNSETPDFKNIGENKWLRDIHLEIPGDHFKDKNKFLLELLSRRADIISNNFNKLSSSLDPEAPTFNYFAQENMTFLPFRYLNVISADLAKRFQKHSDILNNIESIDELLKTPNFLSSDVKFLNDIKNKLLLSKEEFLGLILQDEFIGINRIFEKINDPELEDLKQEAIEIELILKEFLSEEEKKIGDIQNIILRIDYFNNEKILENVKDNNDINFIQNPKIEAILVSFNLIKDYLTACDNFELDKNFNKNFAFLNERTTIEDSEFSIRLTTLDYVKYYYYETQKFIIQKVSLLITYAYNLLINNIINPFFALIADILNYPILVGNYDSINYDLSLQDFENIDLSEQNIERTVSHDESELIDLDNQLIEQRLNEESKKSKPEESGIVSWCWSNTMASVSVISSGKNYLFSKLKF